MALRLRSLSLFLILLLMGRSTALIPSKTSPTNPSSSHSKAISDLKEAIVKGLGFQADDLKISEFDMRDALVGQSVAYEFDIEIGNQVLPFRLLEDVNRWEFVDLPIFRAEEEMEGEEPTGLVERSTKKGSVSPVLAPFQLAGPMELWIQDGDDMRLSLPHDVDAGVLKKVVLADGAMVTIKGARSVSLRHPLDLPLPLNRTTTQKGGFASGLLTLAEHLRLSSISQQDNKPLLSLRIVGPTSLTSSDNSNNNKLKLKRLAPGLIELSSRARPQVEETLPLLTPERFTTLWPLASVNGSNANLQGFEELLTSILGEKAHQEGSFRLTKATVSAQTFMKIGFGVEKGLKEGDVDWSQFPEWRTRPEKVRMHFEVLAKVDGEKVVPERVVQVKDPVELEDSIAPNVLTGNVSMSTTPIVHPAPKYFTL
ncbi:protein TUNICAMYCIN INDUCED 1 [Magnolia sinica]|uniref:protein TUNICAMYCIN INDUCED 1 n=1 Tax=Magnolia sinica TaxID=86752 RepID=UPI002658AEB7|nr:protein TUNICAMYCIN INDUCED 1 [Magnolia sinica]